MAVLRQNPIKDRMVDVFLPLDIGRTLQYPPWSGLSPTHDLGEGQI